MQVLKDNSPNLNDKIEKFNGYIFLDAGQEIKRVLLKDILYIKGHGDYMKVICENDILTVYVTMKNLETLLPKEDFYRVHRSYLVRLDKIESVKTGFLSIGETNIPVSRKHKKEILSLLPWVK
ncbi:MAG: LytTR family transcriptional regulator [Ekhidna sp.]|nr:LytTR family transcriptional regulator [Ekhidna sp.]